MAKIKISDLPELTSPSSNTRNTFFIVTDIESGTPVSKKMSAFTLDTLFDVTVTQANAAYAQSNIALTQANAAFIQANIGNFLAQSAFLRANAITIRANNSLDANNGGTITGNVVISGANLVVSNGATQVFNVRSLSTSGNAATTNGTGTVVIVGGVGVQGNVWADQVYDNGLRILIQANSSFAQANGAFLRANNSLNANLGGTVTANVVVNANLQSANVHSNTFIRFSNTSLVTYTSTGIANGQVEFFNNSLFGTVDTTQGRGFVPVTQFRFLDSNSAYNISTAELAFMGNANGVILTTNSAYEIEWNLFFLKSTAGTVTFSLRFGAAPQIVNAGYVGGVANTSGPANTAGRIVGTADPVALPATPTLGDNTVNYFNIKAFIISNAATSGNCYLSAVTSAGTITPNVGSYIKVTRLPRPNTGLWS